MNADSHGAGRARVERPASDHELGRLPWLAAFFFRAFFLRDFFAMRPLYGAIAAQRTGPRT